jgi:glycosyltransferase involved in cell wall biosynthesis
MSVRKLLVATDEMEIGGSQRQITRLLGGLDRTRWQPELVFFRNESFLVNELRQQGIVVHHLPKRGRLDIGFVLRYAALLRRQRYDVVHAFSLTAELWTAVASLPLRKPPPLVSSVRNLFPTQPPLFWRIKRFILGRSAAVISNSRAGAAETASRTGTHLQDFDNVPNGIHPAEPMPPGQREQFRHALGAPPGRPFGLFVGRLVTQKNLGCLMRALASLPAGQRPWIALAGNGPLRAEIDAMREAAGLDDDVRFLGERSDAIQLMKAADFLVLPSSYEGMSNVLMEAMSAGCPIIASDVGGNPELVEDGATGLIFPADDAAALAVHLRRMSAEPELRARLSASALERVRSRYSIANLVAATEAIYQRCVSAPAARFTHSAAALVSSHSGDKT